MIESGTGHASIAAFIASLHALTSLDAGGQVRIAFRMQLSKPETARALQSK